MPEACDIRLQPAPLIGARGPTRLLDHLEMLLLLAVVVCGLFTVIRTLIRIHLPFEMEYVEGVILNSAWRAAHGGALYLPLRGLPYQIDPYPPLIYKLVGFLLKHTELSFFYPRVVVLTAALMACSLASFVIHHWTHRWKPSLAFGFLPLTVAMVQTWLGIIRYDLIGIALTMAGIAIFVLFPRYRFWSLPFFALAVAGLYTLVAAPAACCLYLWIRHEKPKSLLFGACLSAVLIAGFLYGQHATAGYMGYHLFKTQHSPYSISRLAGFVEALLRGYSLLILFSLVIVWKGFKGKETSFIALYWLLVAGTALSLGKIGAAQNHLLQLVFASCIGAGVGYEWVRQNSSGDWGLAVALASLIAVTAANTPFRLRKQVEDISQCGQAYKAIRQDLGDRVLADNVGALVLAGKPVYVSDPFVFRWLVQGAGLRDDDLRGMIGARKFSAIALDSPVDGRETDEVLWPEDVRQEIRKNYQLTEQFTCSGANFVYQPRSIP
jgi:hypothetical protein